MTEEKQKLIERIGKEGNLKVFMHRGYVCVVLRPEYMKGLKQSRMSIHLCGYVGVPRGHPFYGWDYDTGNVYPPCHGGVTYSGKRLVSSSNLWFIGFDCAHAGDVTYLSDFDSEYGIGTDTYKDMEYVTKEVKKLAEWLRRREGRRKG